jgi:nonsense-mediated mRNA decay protein 3
MDFYFPDKGKAARFISFLENVVPIKVKSSKKLIGTDDKSNISNFKYTNLVEICPLCKDDLLYLPAKLARQLGNISRLVLVKNVSNLIHFIDPLSGQTASMPPEAFWRDPIRPIITAARSRLTRYIVLGKEAAVVERNVSKKTATRKQRNRLATLTVAKERDLGVNDVQFEERSHLGYLMKAGDVCLGYDLTETQFVDDQAEEMRENGKLPDVVVVRKLYGGVASGDVNAAKMRMWRLQRLDVDVAESMRTARAAKRDADEDDMDEEDFLREVEADKEMRGNMNLYKSEVVMKSKGAEGSVNDEDMSTGSNPTVADDDEDDQQVKLDELLDGLVLDEGPDRSESCTDTAFGTGEGEKAAKDGIGFVGREHAGQIRDKDAAKTNQWFCVWKGIFS